jgi:hypothetical protein
MSKDRESQYLLCDLGSEAAYRAYFGKDCNIRLTDEMIWPDGPVSAPADGFSADDPVFAPYQTPIAA